MANAKMTFLNPSEIELIHQESLRVLEEIGIKVHSIPVLKLLKAKGADIDFDACVANQFLGLAACTDIVTGMGCIDDAKGISFEQLVIDAYMWDFVKDFLKGVEISEEMMGFSAIRPWATAGIFFPATTPSTICAAI